MRCLSHDSWPASRSQTLLIDITRPHSPYETCRSLPWKCPVIITMQSHYVHHAPTSGALILLIRRCKARVAVSLVPWWTKYRLCWLIDPQQVITLNPCRRDGTPNTYPYGKPELSSNDYNLATQRNSLVGTVYSILLHYDMHTKPEQMWVRTEFDREITYARPKMTISSLFLSTTARISMACACSSSTPSLAVWPCDGRSLPG